MSKKEKNMKKWRKPIIIFLNIIILFVNCLTVNANNVNCRLKSFDLKEDTFNFTNSVNDLGVKPGGKYKITNSKLKTFYNDYKISSEDQNRMNKLLSNFVGMCGGMTSLVIQNYYGHLELSSYGVSSIHELQKPVKNKKVRDLIGINQIVTSGSKYSKAANNFMLEYKDDTAIKCLYDYACSIKYTNAPVWVSFYWVVDSNKFDIFKGIGMGGHALMVYGIQTIGGPYIVDNEEYKYRLLIVDPNINYSVTELKKEHYVYISENLDKCIIPKTGIIADNESGFYVYNHGKLKYNDDFVFQLITNNLRDIKALGSIEYSNRQADDQKINSWLISRPSITLNKTSISIQVDEKAKIEATKRNTINNIEWSSSNSKIVSVDSDGEICGLKEGKATITATVSGKKVKCRVTVKNKEQESESSLALKEYKKLIQQYEQKYGKAEIRYMSGKPYWTGLCFAKLLDFNNNNIDELILAYQTEISDIKKVQYHIELWTFDGKVAKKITSGISWYGNNIPFFGEFSISKYKGKYLLELTDKAGLLDCYYGTKSSGKLGLLHKFLWKGDIIYGSWYRNGTKISQEKFESYQNIYNVNKTKYVFWKAEYNQIIRNEIEKTKKTLKM